MLRGDEKDVDQYMLDRLGALLEAVDLQVAHMAQFILIGRSTKPWSFAAAVQRLLPVLTKERKTDILQTTIVATTQTMGDIDVPIDRFGLTAAPGERRLSTFEQWCQAMDRADFAIQRVHPGLRQRPWSITLVGEGHPPVSL